MSNVLREGDVLDDRNRQNHRRHSDIDRSHTLNARHTEVERRKYRSWHRQRHRSHWPLIDVRGRGAPKYCGYHNSPCNRECHRPYPCPHSTWHPQAPLHLPVPSAHKYYNCCEQNVESSTQNKSCRITSETD